MRVLFILLLTLCFAAESSTGTTIDASRLMLRFFERAIWASLERAQQESPCPQPSVDHLDEALNAAKEQLDLHRPHCARLVCETYIAQQPPSSFEALEMKSMIIFFGLGGAAPNPLGAQHHCNTLRSIFAAEALLCEERHKQFEWFKTTGAALNQKGQLLLTKRVKDWLRFITPFLEGSQD